MIVSPVVPFLSSSSRIVSSTWSGSGCISQDETSSSVAPSKHNSHTVRSFSFSSDFTGGPKVRHNSGRDEYSSHLPVAGSSTGQGTSLAKSSQRLLASGESSSSSESGHRVARIIGRKFRHRRLNPSANVGRLFRIGLIQFSQPFSQPHGVELVDGKYAYAAVGTSGFAGQPFAASSRGIGQCRICNLYQNLIFGSRIPAMHTEPE